MRYLLYILLATLLATSVASCKTATKVVTMRDTVTITQSITRFSEIRDTMVVHDSTSVEVTRIQFDTLERIKEVQKIVYRNGRQEERGESVKEFVHDTVYVASGRAETRETTPPKPSMIPIVTLAIVLSLLTMFIWHKVR